MAAYNKFEQFVEDLGVGVHDLEGDDLQVYLSNAAPDAAADAVKADLAEITIENGYTGPVSIAASYSQAGGTGSLVPGVDPVVITASGGTVGPFQYVALMNTTPTSPLDPLISWWDYGSEITLQDGETFTIDFGANIFTLT